MQALTGIRLRSLVILSVAFLGLAQGRAQLLTATTLSDLSVASSYGAGLNLTSGLAATQTFSSISSIEGLTFRFIAQDSATFSSTNLAIYFGQWTGAAGTSQSFTSTIHVAANNLWTNSGTGYLYYDAELDLTSQAGSLTPANSYGLTIVGSAASAGNYVLGGAASTYNEGFAYSNTGPVTSFADLATGNGSFSVDNFAFAGTGLSPIPETSTVAVMLCGVFVGALVIRRQRQKRVAVVAA